MLDFFRVKKIPKLFWSSQKTFTLRPRPICLLMLVVGLTLFGVGEALLIASGAGVSPWTVLADGMAKLMGWSIGFSTLVVSSCVLLLWYPLRQIPGIGTILNKQIDYRILLTKIIHCFPLLGFLPFCFFICSLTTLAACSAAISLSIS